MLIEFLTSLTSRAVPGARAAGLVRESAAIAARYKRQKTAWQPHLTACHSAINAALKATDKRGKSSFSALAPALIFRSKASAPQGVRRTC